VRGNGSVIDYKPDGEFPGFRGISAALRRATSSPSGFEGFDRRSGQAQSDVVAQ
jgi:hypothetical protein